MRAKCINNKGNPNLVVGQVYDILHEWPDMLQVGRPEIGSMLGPKDLFEIIQEEIIEFIKNVKLGDKLERIGPSDKDFTQGNLYSIVALINDIPHIRTNAGELVEISRLLGNHWEVIPCSTGTPSTPPVKESVVRTTTKTIYKFTLDWKHTGTNNISIEFKDNLVQMAGIGCSLIEFDKSKIQNVIELLQAAQAVCK